MPDDRARRVVAGVALRGGGAVVLAHAFAESLSDADAVSIVYPDGVSLRIAVSERDAQLLAVSISVAEPVSLSVSERDTDTFFVTVAQRDRVTDTDARPDTDPFTYARPRAG